jgi:carnitine-CoA ligase
VAIQPPNGMGLLRGTGQPFTGYLAKYPIEHRTMLHVLRDRAADRPDQTWLVFDAVDRLTYGQAQAQANQVAHAVLADAGESAHVGLLMRNQIEFMPCFYGAMAAGGVAVPLNADARGPLLLDVIERSHVGVIVVRAELLEVLARLEGLAQVKKLIVAGAGDVPAEIHGVPVVRLADWIADRPTDPPRELPTFSDTAVIQFTSGTTGRQKGAVYPHHFLYLYSAAVSESLGRTEDDVLTTPLPFSHVAAIHIVANSAMHAGATAHLKSKFSASRYWEEIAEDGATFGIIFGPMAAMIMKACDEAPEHRLRQLFCVPPPPERIEFERRYGVDIVWQGYGMTEIYPLPMRADTLPDVPEDTVGYPAQWYDYGVVDEHDCLLSPGEVGELVWRCRLPYGMVTEYFEAPEVTAEVYRNFMFHTGDLAVYDEDGLVHYRGRKNDRIRSRGENINAAEVEFVVLRHPDVLEAAVYGVPAEIGEEDVKLDVILKDGTSVEDLHAWLVENLPRYMVPRYVERRDAFPKTPSERIMKYELRDHPLDRPEVTDFGDRRAPRR